MTEPITSIRPPVNILMVDDQPSKLLSYEAILGELNENLVKAASGREALEKLLKADFAVVLMDVSMPEMDGFELAEMIRQHPRFDRTAIIFISAVHLTDLDRLNGYRRGAVDYISVPVNPELLRAKVTVFAELHRKSAQLEFANHELRRLSTKLLTLQDEERRRLARELHDSLGQDLTVAKLTLDQALALRNLPRRARELAGKAHDVVGGVMRQVRTISYLLHPPLLDDIGLMWTIHWYLEGLAERGLLKCSLDVQPQEFPRLPRDIETSLFRVLQEAINNVMRHSGVESASVRLVESDGRCQLIVKDAGRGIAEEVVGLRPGALGVGLSGVVQRVRQFGGEVRLANLHPGTMMEVVMPLPKVPAEAPREEELVSEAIGKDAAAS